MGAERAVFSIDMHKPVLSWLQRVIDVGSKELNNLLRKIPGARGRGRISTAEGAERAVVSIEAPWCTHFRQNHHAQTGALDRITISPNERSECSDQLDHSLGDFERIHWLALCCEVQSTSSSAYAAEFTI